MAKMNFDEMDDIREEMEEMMWESKNFN